MWKRCGWFLSHLPSGEGSGVRGNCESDHIGNEHTTQLPSPCPLPEGDGSESLTGTAESGAGTPSVGTRSTRREATGRGESGASPLRDAGRREAPAAVFERSG